MIALTIGGIAITSIYAIGAASTRVFHQQHQLASAQTGLRLAVNHVKRDLSRAGFLSTPGVDLPGQACLPIPNGIHAPLGSGRLAAVSIFRNDLATDTASGRSAVDPTAKNRANGFTVDEIVLMGNYETGSEYPGASVMLNDAFRITLSSNWYAFQRDFTNWFTAAESTTEELYDPDMNAFRRVFARGRMLRMRMPSGQVHFSTVGVVADPVAGNIIIPIDNAVPPDCAASATGGWVAPVSTIRYTVRNAPAAELPADFAETTGPMAQLIREEVQPGDKTTLLAGGAGRRVILDYVVGFNLEFASTAATPPGAADQYLPGRSLPQAPDNDDDTPPTAADHEAATLAVNANPERLRSAVIDIAVRAPEQDPTFPWTLPTGANCTRMRCFQVFPTTGTGAREGASRVRRLRTEVFLPNIANEGY